MILNDEFGLAANAPYYAMAFAMMAFALWVRATGRASLAHSRAITAERALGDVGRSLQDLRAAEARLRR
jgi:hypothetical protein